MDDVRVSPSSALTLGVAHGREGSRIHAIDVELAIEMVDLVL
jgi:transcription antitermination factor NusA-like protein